MNREDIDRMWVEALRQAGKANEPTARYRFAALVSAAERESIAKRFDGPVWSYDYREIAATIQATGEQP